MKKQITLRYAGGRMFTAPYGTDDLSGIPEGAEYLLELKRPRNIKHHRKFFAMMNFIYDNLPEEIARYLVSIDDMRFDLMLLAGQCESYVRADTGEVVRRPKSIAFASMGQEEFGQVYNAVLDAAIQHYFSGDESIREYLALNF